MESEIYQLLDRMREGDREAAARFLSEYGPRFFHRIRGKISRRIRDIYDSAEIMSTVQRRLDVYVRTQRIAAADPTELWALINRMIDHAVIEKTRKYDSVRRLEQESAVSDSTGDSAPLSVVESDESELAMNRLIASLADPVDRHILYMRLHGMPHSVIAMSLDMKVDAVRQRWHQISSQLRQTQPA